jgi:K+ transporter
MYEDIKSIIGKIFGFFLMLWFLTVVGAYTLGNYYGMKTTYENPRIFHAQIAPGYLIMLVENPDMQKFKSASELKKGN